MAKLWHLGGLFVFLSVPSNATLERGSEVEHSSELHLQLLRDFVEVDATSSCPRAGQPDPETASPAQTSVEIAHDT